MGENIERQHPGRSTISYDLVFLLSLALKLVLSAAIVVSASVMVERAGPLVGALVVTLPVTMWPAYVFLSLDHDAGYILASAESGLAINAVTAVFMLVYIVLARTRGLAISLAVAIACWIGLALFVRSLPWTVTQAGLLNLVLYSACLGASSRFREAHVPRIARQWYELPLRTALVCALMGTLLVVSHVAGPTATGMLAVFPISTTCTMLIVHTRIGGAASAAVIANGLWGLLGIGFGLYALAVAIDPLGLVIALGLALIVPVAWNFSVWILRHPPSRSPAMRGPRSST